MDKHSGGSILVASFLFCFQLYGDFAGYSYVAIGASKVMGFRLMDNFLRPYFFSTSIQEYWKRNHISLTTWFMDYIYYPMVGYSVNIYWWCFCIFFTFFLSGFWHGANWTYVVCFSIFGFYLVVCTLKDKRQRKFEKRHGLKKKAWWLWLNRITTFFLVMIALVFFRANDIADGGHAIFEMSSDFYDGLLSSLWKERFSFLTVLFLFIIEYFIENKKTSLIQQHFVLSNIIISLVLIFIILFGGNLDGGQFIYFQF